MPIEGKGHCSPIRTGSEMASRAPQKPLLWAILEQTLLMGAFWISEEGALRKTKKENRLRVDALWETELVLSPQ